METMRAGEAQGGFGSCPSPRGHRPIHPNRSTCLRRAQSPVRFGYDERLHPNGWDEHEERVFLSVLDRHLRKKTKSKQLGRGRDAKPIGQCNDSQ
eukprot:scaffold1401_cov330-Pavlova_lutheri.AAC.50